MGRLLAASSLLSMACGQLLVRGQRLWRTISLHMLRERDMFATGIKPLIMPSILSSLIGGFICYVRFTPGAGALNPIGVEVLLRGPIGGVR